MGILNYFGITAAPRRIVAYAIQSPRYGVEEIAPVGSIPAPSKRYENKARKISHEHRSEYIRGEIGSYPIVLRWRHDHLVAFCFEAEEIAMMYPGFDRLSREELGATFDHFTALSVVDHQLFDDAHAEHPADHQPEPNEEDPEDFRVAA